MIIYDKIYVKIGSRKKQKIYNFQKTPKILKNSISENFFLVYHLEFHTLYFYIQIALSNHQNVFSEVSHLRNSPCQSLFLKVFDNKKTAKNKRCPNSYVSVISCTSMIYATPTNNPKNMTLLLNSKYTFSRKTENV